MPSTGEFHEGDVGVCGKKANALFWGAVVMGFSGRFGISTDAAASLGPVLGVIRCSF